jgi:plastocyanin
MLALRRELRRIGGVLSIRVVLTGVVLLAAALTGCGDDGDASPGGDDGASPPFETRVEITEDGYEPRDVRVLVGGSVTFVNMDRTQSHTAETGDLDGLPPGQVGATDNSEFDTHTLTWEEPYTVTFHKPGKVTYHSSFNQRMTGTVDVVTRTDPSG